MSIRDEAWIRACKAWDAMKKANPPPSLGPTPLVEQRGCALHPGKNPNCYACNLKTPRPAWVGPVPITSYCGLCGVPMHSGIEPTAQQIYEAEQKHMPACAGRATSPPTTFHGKPVTVDPNVPGSLGFIPVKLDPTMGPDEFRLEPAKRGLEAWLPVEGAPHPLAGDRYAGIDKKLWAPATLPQPTVTEALEKAWEQIREKNYGDVAPFGQAVAALDAAPTDDTPPLRENGPGIAALDLKKPSTALDMSSWADDYDLLEDA